MSKEPVLGAWGLTLLKMDVKVAELLHCSALTLCRVEG